MHTRGAAGAAGVTRATGGQLAKRRKRLRRAWGFGFRPARAPCGKTTAAAAVAPRARTPARPPELYAAVACQLSAAAAAPTSVSIYLKKKKTFSGERANFGDGVVVFLSPEGSVCVYARKTRYFYLDDDDISNGKK